MNNDKRKTRKPIPTHLKNFLNASQRVELQTIEGFGWNLKFIRRPLFKEPVAVVTSPDEKLMGVLEKDGRLNMKPKLTLRTS